MQRSSFKRVACAFLLVAGLAAGLTSAACAETGSQTAAAAPPALSAAQAHDLVTLLSDPARRTRLIDTLEALEKVAPAAAPAAASAPAAAPAKAPLTPAAAAARAVTSSGLLSQLVRAAPKWGYGIFAQVASLRRVLAGIPASWAWMTRTATDDAARSYAMHVGFGLLVVLAPSMLAAIALRRLLRNRRMRLGALATPDDPANAANEGKKPLGQRLMGSARLLSLALLAFVLDVAPLVIFTVLAYLLTPALTEPGPAQLVVLGVVDAFAVFSAVLCIARALFAPAIPALRLVPVSDAAAASCVRWIGWLEGIAVFGMAILNMALLLGLDPTAELALQKLVLLVDHLLLVVLVLSHRRAVAAHLRAPKRHASLFGSVLTGLSEVWHIVAVFLIMGVWLIWAADWQGGYTHLLEFIVTALVIGIVTRLLTEGLLIVLRHVLQVADPNGNNRLSAFGITARSRAARYYPVLRAAISAIMWLIGVVVLLELSGVSSIGWLLGSTLGWQIFSAFVSIVVTLCIAVLAWEGTNVAMDRHLDRLSRQAQLTRVTRLRTLQPMMRTALAIAILVLVVLTTLSQIGVNIAPLLAGAGIVGVAIGFGSQKLVQDLITGLFLLLEDAMQVGDWVTLAGVSGSVENLSIRTIRLRAGDGSLHIIPFSSVTMVNNTNRGLGNAAVSVTVGAHEDPDAVGEVLKAIVQEMRQDPAFKPMILSDLQFWGVDKVDGSSLVLVGQIVCTDSGRWGVQREFNRRYRKRFNELGIEIPNPTQTLLVRESSEPRAAAPSPRATGETATTVAESPPSA
jgi:small-conductance mechanosensitive channel